MTGVSWRPPRTGWLGQRCAGRSLEGALGGTGRALGGEAVERMGGGGRADGERRRPVKVTDSRERWPGGPSSGGYRPGGSTVRWKGSEGSKQTKHTTRKLTPC